MAIVPATGTPSEFVDTLRGWRMPHVFMTRYVAGSVTHYVGADDVRGGYLAAEHLLSHGVRTICYVGGLEPVQSRRDRMEGARKAVADGGLDPDEVFTDLESETSGPGGLAAVNRLLDADGGLPEAIMCHSDNVAFGALRALRIRGRHRDVRVTGYDDIDNAALWEPPLTTVSAQSEDLGQLAARLLATQISDGESEAQVLLNEPTLSVRESCGCLGATDPTAD